MSSNLLIEKVSLPKRRYPLLGQPANRRQAPHPVQKRQRRCVLRTPHPEAVPLDFDHRHSLRWEVTPWI